MDVKRVIRGSSFCSVWGAILNVLVIVSIPAVGYWMLLPAYGRVQAAAQHYPAAVAFEKAKEWAKPAAEYEAAMRVEARYGDTSARLTTANETSVSVESDHPYANNQESNWTVTNPDPNAIASSLHFTRLELEDGIDYLVLTDAADKPVQQITGAHPDGLWSDPVPGKHIRIHLYSDSCVTQWGFAVDRVRSENYPSLARSAHPYDNDTHEELLLTNRNPGAQGSRVHFSRVDVEKDVDYIAVADPQGNVYQYITGSYPNGLWSVGVPGKHINLHLVSDQSVQSWGFNVDGLVTTSDLAEPVTFPSFEEALVESAHPYEDKFDRTWTLVNPDTNAVSSKIRFSRIDLYNDQDVIRIFDAEGTLIQAWRGGHYENLWTDYVPGAIVKVQLVTNKSGNDWGFRVDHIVHGETQPVLAQSDHPYSGDTNKTWTIINPDANAVSSRIRFSRLDLYNDQDVIRISDAEDTLVQTIKGGHHENWWTDSVPGAIVKVQFVTNKSNNDWGFRIDDIESREN